MLTPDDITKKTFTVRHVRGYDPQEVDDFLDRVVADYSTVLQQLNAANVDLSRYRSGASTQQLPPVVTPPIQSNPIGDVARLLAVAQQSADQQAADAKAAADRVIADAQAAGSKLVADAGTQAAQIVAEGTSKRNEIVGALEVQRSELQDKVNALAAAHADTVAKLKAALDQLGAPATS
jgi:cell division initiation protein